MGFLFTIEEKGVDNILTILDISNDKLEIDYKKTKQ